MKPKMITPRAFLNRYFDEDSRPVTKTVVNWIKRGDLAGECIGGSWFVYVDADTGQYLTGDMHTRTMNTLSQPEIDTASPAVVKFISENHHVYAPQPKARER